MSVKVFSFLIFGFGLGHCLIGLTAACGQVGISVGEGEANESKESKGAEYLQNELLVKFKAGVNAQDIAGIHNQLGTRVINVLADGRLYYLKVPAFATLEEVKNAYEARPEVEYVEVNFVVGIDTPPGSQP